MDVLVTDSLYDRVLIFFAWAGPLCLVALGGWQTSLETWYFTPARAATEAFAGNFVADVSRWMNAHADDETRITLIVDRECPCTRSTIIKIEAERRRIGNLPPLRVVYLDDTAGPDRVALAAVLDGIPSTPTLIVMDGASLRYAGPAVSGGTCTGSEQRILGLATLTARPASPVLNPIDRGCYCPLSRG
ncbi:hypothetical protein DKG74_06120 [Zavarzinia aquatilis]|uniref:DUF6436 domain-containing protein n=1 Tax=Zavarzinia aquatilis TaxID=2211142 RepID=A0A317EJB4_9PROT|nr:hypothetical protein DKG74_06120 [Zavarzinia aquatilis]